MGDPPQTVFAQVFGTLKAFEPESENISTYLERVHLYFEANGIQAAKQTSVLLTVIGAKNYSIIRSLVAPALPKDKGFDELEGVLKAHFQPKPLLIAEHFRFYQRAQAAGESVQDFVADLRRLAISCEFGEFLDQALRDRFVCGLKSKAIQKKLLAEDKLTIARAVELARGMEVAAVESKELKLPSGTHHSGGKNFEASSQGASATTACLSCGKSDHARWDCRFRNATGHDCGNTGHIASVCKSAARQGHRRGQHRKIWKAHQVLAPDQTPAETVNTETEGNEFGLYAFSVNIARVKPITVNLQVSGQKLRFEIDTGAAVSIISMAIFRKEFPTAKLNPSKIELQTYTGEPLQVNGTYSVEVHCRNQEYRGLELTVVSGNGLCLLGRDWFQHIRLDWPVISAVTQDCNNCTLLDVLTKYGEVFADELGTMQHFQAKVTVAKDASPKFHRARPVPYALKSKVEEELDRLKRDDIIERLLTVIGQLPSSRYLKKAVV